MKIGIFGLTVSSSWGNCHATLWRGLIRALDGLGHRVVFYERDVPYYAARRDLTELPGGQLMLHPEWAECHLLLHPASERGEAAPHQPPRHAGEFADFCARMTRRYGC